MMELDNDLQDALTYLDETRRKEAVTYLEAAKDSPAEFALRRMTIMAEAEEAAGRRAVERRRLQNRRMMGQAGAKPAARG